MRSLRAAQATPALAPQPMAAAPVGPVAAPTLPRPDMPPQSRRTMVRVRNGKMIKQLGLSDAKVESLIDVLAAQDERAMALRLSDPAAATSDEVRARNRPEVAAVIGPEAAEKLDVWQQRAHARMKLRRVRDQLDELGEPLSDAQLARITELIHARPQMPPPSPEKDEPAEAFTARFKSWRNDTREQIRAEVSAVLEPRQLARYDELDEMSRSFEKNMSMIPPSFVSAPQAWPNAGRAAPSAR